MSKKEEILSQLEQAIDNNWMLRPIKSSDKGMQFLNIDYQTDIPLTDISHILGSVDDLKKFPRGCNAFALASPLIEDFVCIDLDFKDDPEMESEIFDVCLAQYKKEDLFIRKGNPKNPGQIWFRCFSNVPYHSDTCLDIFTREKRCDALGSYKGSDEQIYTWPYKKFWEHTPEDLPIIRIDIINEIIDKVRNKYGSRKKNKNEVGGRHDWLLDYARKKITLNMTPTNAMRIMMETDVFKDISSDKSRKGESAHNEVSRIISSVITEQLKSEIYYQGEIAKEDDKFSIMKFAEPIPPKVEENSFFDLIYRAIRRNQVVDNKKVAFATTLNICSWLASLFVRYEGMCPNLMILYVAESGGGKSSTTKITKQIINHIPELRESFRTSGIGSTAAIARFISESPVCNLNIDEFSKVMKNKNKEHLGDLPEILCQWYSDFDDYGIPEAINSLKSETNGIAIGAKLCALMSTTPSVFNNFNEGLFEQGFGRRIFPIIDNDFSPLVKNFEYETRFFRESEIGLIKMVVENYIFNKDGKVFDTIDISKFKFVKSVEKGVTDYHTSCRKSRISLNMRSSKELHEYINNDFIDETNKIRKSARYFGSSIQSYLANSRIEMVKKLAAIHTIFGKTMSKDNILNVNSIVEMDSFEWGMKTFGHYVIHEAMETYDEIFDKKMEISSKNESANSFLAFLDEKKVHEFSKSTKEVHNFFKDKKNSKLLKSTVINNLIESKRIIQTSGKHPDSRGAIFRVVGE